MWKKSRHLGRAILVTVALVALNGCGGKDPTQFTAAMMTGGGWIPSGDKVAGHKANFGFNAAQCAPGEFSGHFNYHDKYLGVKMVGTVIGAKICGNGVTCESGCPADSIEVTMEYRSTNPKDPGAGLALACLQDHGEGANAPQEDQGRIKVTTGPFAGYENRGPVQGNIQEHTCTCNDESDNDGDGLIDAADPACQDPVTGAWKPNGDEE